MLVDRRPAFAQVHFPPEGESFTDLQNHTTAAHKRLIFEELFFLEVGLELKRRKMRERPGISFALTEKVARRSRKLCRSNRPVRKSACSEKLPMTCSTLHLCGGCFRRRGLGACLRPVEQRHRQDG